MKRIIIILGIGMCLALNLPGQDPPSNSKKAIEYYNRGLQQYSINEYARAAEYLTKAVTEDSAFIRAWLILAQVYEDWKQTSLAVATYRKALSVDPDFYPLALVQLARLEYGQAQYRESQAHYKQYLALPGNKSEKHIERAKDGIARCDFSIRAVENPVDFKPVSAGVLQ
jgi:Tfp pilus assembly protein PilF